MKFAHSIKNVVVYHEGMEEGKITKQILLEQLQVKLTSLRVEQFEWKISYLGLYSILKIE